MSREMLSVESVAYAYAGNGWRLRKASFGVHCGDVLGIIGPNGSGKSTLLKLAAGVLPSDTGVVRLLGKDIRRLKRREIARILGYLPQRVESQVDYTVQEIVAMGRFAHLRGGGFLCAHDLEVIARCLELTDIVSLRQRRLSRLSGGERQRVFLASVIAQEPQVLLLDEPTTALDIHHQMRVFEILVQLAQKDMGVVVVTHDLNLASVFCGQVLLLKQGVVEHYGNPEEILKKEILEDAYGEGLETVIHPITGRPVVVPAARGRSNRAGGL